MPQNTGIDSKELERERKKIRQEPARLSQKSNESKFNTFSGVFIPSVLAIFGAVMYLILPRVLGGIGLIRMLGIIILAHTISTATAFSLSAITTNIKIGGGGLYYLISRSLGSEFGGSLGIQLFLAQAVSIGFYVIAFSKGVAMLFAYFNVVINELYTAIAACIIFAILAYKGASFVIKIQYVILGAIILSLFSIFLGPSAATPQAQAVFELKLPFWVAFAMFFPAVVGIDAGVGMSGDLKNPKKSLVTGTFLAIFFTCILYVLLTIKLAGAAGLEQLFTDEFIITKIAMLPGFVIAGILLATASSALSYFMTSPRTLRAMSHDNIFPSKLRFLGKSIGKSNEPRIALLVSFAIAIGIIYTGGLILVAQIVTIFFLNVYGWINAAAFFEKISRNPSYRPSFNPPSFISFYGMIVCYVIMFLFNKWIMIASILLQVLIFFILFKTKTSIKLESVWDGVLFQFLRKTIEKIEETAKSKKNWRPTIVAFCANGVNRNIMFSVLEWIGAHTGIMKFYYLISGRIEEGTATREKIEEDIKQYIKENNLKLYPRVIEAKYIEQAVETTLQSETIGNLPPNTALIDYDSKFELGKLIKLAARLKKNVLILKNNTGFSDFKFVDVWWNEPDNGNLMILIAYLITHSTAWKEKGASIRVFKVVRSREEYSVEEAKLKKLINEARIDNITVQVIIESRKSMPNIIYENSHYADLVLMGLPHLKSRGIYPDIMDEIEKYTAGLTTSMIVLANDKIDFRIN